MHPEESDLNQKAVLWENTGTDSYGRPTVASPVEIDCRWETVNREVTDPRGNVVGIESVAQVNQEIPVGSILWLGEEDDLPSPPTNLRKVVSCEYVPDVKGRATYREVALQKYGDSLPDLTS